MGGGEGPGADLLSSAVLLLSFQVQTISVSSVVLGPLAAAQNQHFHSLSSTSFQGGLGAFLLPHGP